MIDFKNDLFVNWRPNCNGEHSFLTSSTLQIDTNKLEENDKSIVLLDIDAHAQIPDDEGFPSHPKATYQVQADEDVPDTPINT